MAWIKIEINTPDKPEVIDLAEMLGISPNDALGSYVRLLCWADQNVADETDPVKGHHVDHAAGIRGFAEALIKVGWMKKHGELIYFHNFEKHNGDSAKRRASNSANRQRKRDANKPGPPYEPVVVTPPPERDKNIMPTTLKRRIALEKFLGRDATMRECQSLENVKTAMDKNPVVIDGKNVDPDNFIVDAIEKMGSDITHKGCVKYIEAVVDTCRTERRMPERKMRVESKESRRNGNKGQYHDPNFKLKIL